MPMYLVVLARSGPEWEASKPLEAPSDWPEHAAFMDQLVDEGFLALGRRLADEVRPAHAVEAASEEAIRPTSARDPGSQTHLRLAPIDEGPIRRDARRRGL